MERKNIFILSGIFVFILAVILILNSAGLLSSYDLKQSGTFYQSYPQISTFPKCYAPDSELEKDWSKESIIKTDTATFKIVVTKDPFRTERSSGHVCAVVLADYKVYRNGVLIDTISTKAWEDLIQSEDACNRPNPVQMQRAYSDDGSIKGELEDLPNGLNGIEVFFSAKGYSDTLTTTYDCRQYHIENYFNYVVGDNFGIEVKTLSTDKILYELDSPGNYYAFITNKITGVGLVPTEVITKVNLVKGKNMITLNTDYSQNSNLQTEITLYKRTTEFSGLNADSTLFEPFSGNIRFSENTYFEIDTISLKTLDLEFGDEQIEIEKDKEQELNFFQKIWNFIKRLFTNAK